MQMLPIGGCHREDASSTPTTTQGKPSQHVTLSPVRLVPAVTSGGLISAGLLSLREGGTRQAALGRPPPSQAPNICASQGVDLEAPNSPVLANHSAGIPKIPLNWREGTTGRTKSKGNRRECGWLPGIQCHSSPCRILVVWGRRAPSARSSPLRCLETRDQSILNQHIFSKTIHNTALQFQSNNQRTIA